MIAARQTPTPMGRRNVRLAVALALAALAVYAGIYLYYVVGGS